jgi:tetratricopeptide (TPR) repeat protein
VSERAGGNAFYLEELVRQVASGDDRELPGSVVAMAEAQLKSLPTDARRVLRAASIFGDAFWAAGVGHLMGADVDPLLDDLTARELVQRRESTRFAGAEELVFRHALMREAAYAMLTDADRVLGHRLAGQWLEGVAAPPHLLVHHFVAAGDHHAAARHAFAEAHVLVLRAQFPEAATLLENADEWLGRGPGDPELLTRILLLAEFVADSTGRPERRAALTGRLFRHLADGPPGPLAEVWVRHGNLAIVTGRTEDADHAFTQAVALARTAGARNVEVKALRGRAFLRGREGRFAEALPCHEAVLALDREMGNEVAYATDLCSHALALSSAGDLEGALERLEEAGAIALVHQRERISLQHVLHVTGSLWREHGDLDRALDCYRRAMAVEDGDEHFIYSLRTHDALAGVLWQKGQIDPSLRVLHEALAIGRRVASDFGVARTLRFLGELEGASGRRAEAVAHLGEAAALFDKLEDGAKTAETRGARARLLHALGVEHWTAGRFEEALESYVEARDLFVALGEPGSEGAMRNSIGATLRSLGRLDDAAVVLAEALTHNRRHGQRTLIADALTVLGHVHAASGADPEARTFWEEALELRREAGETRAEAWLLCHLARLWARSGAAEETAACLGAARELLAHLDDPHLAGTIAKLAVVSSQ